MLGIKYGDWGKEKYGMKAKVPLLEWYRCVCVGIVCVLAGVCVHMHVRKGKGASPGVVQVRLCGHCVCARGHVC